MAVVLGHDDIFFGVFIFDSTHWCDIGQVIGTNDDTTSVDAHLTVGVLQLLSVGQHGRHVLVVTIEHLLQLGHIFVAVL